MVPAAVADPPPTPEDIRRIAAIADPVRRNLEITLCYYRLSAAFSARTGNCANWCTFATWASKQAGATIRGEDWIAVFEENTLTGGLLAHPVERLWRVLLRRGLLTPTTLLGRIVEAVHSPFDALQRASAAVARGNLKVFEEIGLEFARCLQTSDRAAFINSLKPGAPPGGQDLLRSAFARYALEPPTPKDVFFANVEIGLHEQTRLQPEIQEALETAPATAEDLGTRALRAIYPGARNWSAFVRRPLAAALAPVAKSFSDSARRLTRRMITASLMRLSIPGVTIELGSNLDRASAPSLSGLTDSELRALLGTYTAGDCGAADWAELDQRMAYILRLFRAFQDSVDLLACPFDRRQVEAISAGGIPSGRL